VGPGSRFDVHGTTSVVITHADGGGVFLHFTDKTAKDISTKLGRQLLHSEPYFCIHFEGHRSRFGLRLTQSLSVKHLDRVPFS